MWISNLNILSIVLVTYIFRKWYRFLWVIDTLSCLSRVVHCWHQKVQIFESRAYLLSLPRGNPLPKRWGRAFSQSTFLDIPFLEPLIKKSKTIDDYHNNGLKVVGMLFKCQSHVGQTRDQLRVVWHTDTDFHFRWRESLFFKSENLVVGLIRVTDRGHH